MILRIRDRYPLVINLSSEIAIFKDNSILQVAKYNMILKFFDFSSHIVAKFG